MHYMFGNIKTNGPNLDRHCCQPITVSIILLWDGEVDIIIRQKCTFFVAPGWWLERAWVRQKLFGTGITAPRVEWWSLERESVLWDWNSILKSGKADPGSSRGILRLERHSRTGMAPREKWESQEIESVFRDWTVHRMKGGMHRSLSRTHRPGI